MMPSHPHLTNPHTRNPASTTSHPTKRISEEENKRCHKAALPPAASLPARCGRARPHRRVHSPPTPRAIQSHPEPSRAIQSHPEPSRVSSSLNCSHPQAIANNQLPSSNPVSLWATATDIFRITRVGRLALLPSLGEPGRFVGKAVILRLCAGNMTASSSKALTCDPN